MNFLENKYIHLSFDVFCFQFDKAIYFYMIHNKVINPFKKGKNNYCQILLTNILIPLILLIF